MARNGPDKTYDEVELNDDKVKAIELSEYVPIEVAASWTGLLNSSSLSSRLAREGVERVTVVRTEDLLAAFPKPRTKRKYVRKSE